MPSDCEKCDDTGYSGPQTICDCEAAPFPFGRSNPPVTDADTEAGRGEGRDVPNENPKRWSDPYLAMHLERKGDETGWDLTILALEAARRLRGSVAGGEHNPNPRPIEGVEPEKYHKITMPDGTTQVVSGPLPGHVSSQEEEDDGGQ